MPDPPSQRSSRQPTRRQRIRQRKGVVEALAKARASILPTPTEQINVGNRLRQMRRERGLSMRSLAELSGLNVNTLSLIENNKTSPSVSTLQQLAQALQVAIGAFFETTTEPKTVVFQKAGHRPRVGFTCGILEDLGAGLTLHGGQPLLVSLEPGASRDPTPIVHTGQEFVYCLEGKLQYTIDGKQYLLEAGDSLIFEAHLPHCWGNAGDHLTRSLLILCPADEHDRPTDQHFTAD